MMMIDDAKRAVSERRQRRFATKWLIGLVLPPILAAVLIVAGTQWFSDEAGLMVELRENGRVIARMSQTQAVTELERRVGFDVVLPRELPDPELELMLVDHVQANGTGAALFYYQSGDVITDPVEATRMYILQSPSDEWLRSVKNLDAELTSARTVDISYAQSPGSAYYWFRVDEGIVLWEFRGKLPNKEAVIDSLNRLAEQMGDTQD